MRLMRIVCIALMGFISMNAYTQTDSTSIEGYVYESGNRGYLAVAKVLIKDGNRQVAETFTDLDGFFKQPVLAGKEYTLEVIKDMFESRELTVMANAGQQNFAKVEMKRTPGYIFEITLAEKSVSKDSPTDAITDTRIEVYNNTTEEEVLVYENYTDPAFRVNLIKGNHYTILIRKEDYLAKRMEAFVDVEGCILCFEGVGSIRPGVSETMTEGNDNGLLLANVEMERVYTGKKMEIENIYYQLDKAILTNQAKQELDKVIVLMKDNPRLSLELGSHTDSRGKTDYNMELSQRRADACVKYLLDSGDVRRGSIVSRGYGESQLTNKCADGVNCSEAEHAKNRRTELKITGVLEPTRYKSLAEMKREEKLEAEVLQGDEGANQLELLPGETLEDALKRLKGENNGEGKNEPMEKPDDQPQVNKIEIAEEEIVDPAKIIENTPRERAENRNSEDKPSGGLGGLQIDAPALSAEANGPMIALYVGAERLPMTHKIFKVFKHVRSYYDGTEYYYISEQAYDSPLDAEAYLTQHIKTDFPKARVVMVQGGRVVR